MAVRLVGIQHDKAAAVVVLLVVVFVLVELFVDLDLKISN